MTMLHQARLSHSFCERTRFDEGQQHIGTPAGDLHLLRLEGLMRKHYCIAGILALTITLTVHSLAQSPALSGPAPAAPRKSVAILIFDNVQIIDFTGPWEVLDEHFDVFTVAETLRPVITSAAMSINPKYTIENAPKAEILVIPGGGGSGSGKPGVGQEVANPKVIQWVREEAKDAQYVMSVCNGAFILSKAGLLDGQTATTTAGYIELLKTLTPRAKVVADQRYVDNGKIITTAGLSSGIDGALHIIDKAFGRGSAQFAALGEEYDWNPDNRFVRAQLGDMPMLNTFVRLKFVMHAKPLKYDTSNQLWHSEWLLETPKSVSEVMTQLNNTIANQDHWTRQRLDSGGDGTSAWTISSETWGNWKASVHAEVASETDDRVKVVIQVDRLPNDSL
jgi:putative intracellular protease/amidase